MTVENVPICAPLVIAVLTIVLQSPILWPIIKNVLKYISEPKQQLLQDTKFSHTKDTKFAGMTLTRNITMTAKDFDFKNNAQILCF